MQRDGEEEQQAERSPDVYYVPGAINHYKYDYDVIVLDEELKDYPKAHDLILRHEQRHATEEGSTFLGLLRHEFESDVEFYLGSGEAVEEARRYYRKRDDGSLPVATRWKCDVANALRNLWTPLFRMASRFRGGRSV